MYLAVGVVLVEQLHPAIAGDAVADVNDEIAFAQVEEAVDGARFQPAARLHHAHFLAVKQLLTAKDDDTSRDSAAFPSVTLWARSLSIAARGFAEQHRNPARTRPVTSRSRSDCASLPAASTSPSRLHSASL